jgi:hypothetical protein
MAAPVPLARIVDALDMLAEEFNYYLHKPTGEVIMVSHDDLAAAEEGEEEDMEELPDWRQQGMREARQVLESDDYVRLPSKFDVHDWDIMRRFCYRVEDEELSQALLNAIHGPGAFRFFKHLVRENGIEKDWYAFRESALEEIAIDWLVANHIPYTREKPEYSEESEDEK